MILLMISMITPGREDYKHQYCLLDPNGQPTQEPLEEDLQEPRGESRGGPAAGRISMIIMLYQIKLTYIMLYY